MCFPHCEHRDELYIQIDNERNEFIQLRFRLLDEFYLPEINPHHGRSSGSNTALQTVQSHPAEVGSHCFLEGGLGASYGSPCQADLEKNKQPHHVRSSGIHKDL